MEKIKVLLIAHASMSFFVEGSNKTLEQFIIDDWFSLTAQQIKKFHPEIEVECWNPERSFKQKKEFNYQNVKYRQFPTTISPMYGLDFSVSLLKELQKEVEKSKRQEYKLIIHLHEYHSLHGLAIASFFGKEKIIGQHHGGSWPFKHLKESKKKRWFFPFFAISQFWENRILKNIKIFYALSPQEIAYLKKRTKNSEIKFQTMGIDDFYFKLIDKHAARKKLGWPLGKKIIINLGRINHIKGTKYLIDAMKKLPDVELKIIGYGPQLEEFKEYAKFENLKNIEFLGAIFGEDKLTYLSSADAFILPSSKEGASVSVMEAMAQNLPIVTTDIAGMPLMIKNNQEGFVIKQKKTKEIAKAIKKILKWKNRNIKKYAERYKWERIVKNTVNDYKKLK